MSADNRGGGVTYRERKKRKDGDRLSFWLCFSFGFRGTGGVTYREGKGRTETGFLLALAFFSFAYAGRVVLTLGTVVGWSLGTTRQLRNLLGWTGRGGDGYLFVYLLVLMLNAWPGIAFFFLLHFLSLSPRPHFIIGTY